ncbi:MAG TPA: class I tRNA ligase family protein, partial [Promineifilum sp.]|nr:class I tRNA ligase family protein [Promineifilum sp.]
ATGAPVAYSPADRWILTRLSETIATVDRLMDGYLYGEAGRQIYDFLWGDFADWYVEITKVQLNAGGETTRATLDTLVTTLDYALRLLHPFIPYVTEETWQQLRRAVTESGLDIVPPGGWGEALIIADWPKPIALGEGSAAADFEAVRELIRRIRNVRAEQGVAPARYIPAVIVAGDRAAFLASQRPILVALARLDDAHLSITATAEPPAQALTVALGPITAYLPLAGMVDLDAEQARLTKELAELDKQIARLTSLLDSPFAQKAPAAVVQKEREKLAQLSASREEIDARLGMLAG